MKNIKRYILMLLLLCILVMPLLETTALANSAEPPALVILVNNPPKDLSIVLLTNESEPIADVSKLAWEGYYAFYRRDIESQQNHTFKITTAEKSFDITLNEHLEQYHNVFTLDLEDETLTKGTSTLRSVSLISSRVILTLLIEAIIFWIFGFRERKSWIIFLIINLITQGILNTWLNGSSALLPTYLTLNLIIGEIFVFGSEMIAFPILIHEHKKSHILTYVFIANMLSLIAGGFIITLLPV